MSDHKHLDHGMHTHMDEHGNIYMHSHHDSSGEEHGHGSTHSNTKAISNRLAKAIGHLEKVKRMVDSEEDCAQILIQLSAVKSAINNAGNVLLIDHINECIEEAVEHGDMDKLEELNEAITRFVK